MSVRRAALLVMLLLVPPPALASTHAAELWAGGILVSTHPTVQTAIDAAQAGDTIKVVGGTHFESVLFDQKLGTPSQPITLTSRDGEMAILDGSIAELTVANALWTPAPPATGFPSDTWAYTVPPGTAPDALAVVSRLDGLRLFTHTDPVEFAAGLPGPGLYYDGAAGTLYARLEPGESPNDVPLHVSFNDATLWIDESDHVHVRDLEVQHGASRNVLVRHSDAAVLEDLTIRGGRIGINVTGSCNDTLIRRVTLSEHYDSRWTWDDVKNAPGIRVQESCGICAILVTGVGTIVEDCDVSGYFDGVMVGSLLAPAFPADNRVRGTRIHDIRDDAFTILNQNAETQIYDNRIEDVSSGFSVCCGEGPLYLYRNEVLATKSVYKNRVIRSFVAPKVFKIGGLVGDPSRELLVYHNTFISTKWLIQAPFFQGVLPEDYSWRNNIFYSSDTAIDSLKDTLATFVRGSGLASAGNSFDGDVYWRRSTEPKTVIKDWNAPSVSGQFFGSLDEARTSPEGIAAGWEASGMEADPRFEDSTPETPGAGPGADLLLRSDSPAIDAGVFLPPAWPDLGSVEGAAPDPGAWEHVVTAAAPDLADDDVDGDGVPDDGDGSGQIGDAPCSCGSGDDPATCAVGCDDNCRYRPNADQLDRGGDGTPLGSGARLPDGVGDVCQCGDMSGDGAVDGADLVLYRREFAGLPSAFSTDRCSLSGPDGTCDVEDVVVLRRALAGAASGPLANACSAYLGLPDPGAL